MRSATVRYRGEVAHKNTRLITASFAAGWMEAAMAEQVNLVNAELVARERGIAIVEEKSTDTGDFGTLIQTEVVTDKKSYVAAGTLFGKEFLRLVRLGPYRLDAHFDGNLFVFTHRDVPGLIGFIGNTFGRHGVNIAQMNVGASTMCREARPSAWSSSIRFRRTSRWKKSGPIRTSSASVLSSFPNRASFLLGSRRIEELESRT